MRYQCISCNTVFTDKYTARRHFENQHIEQTCPICGERFPKKVMKINHLRKKHQVQEQWSELRPISKFVCDTCGKEFFSKSKLRSHFNFSHKTVKCTECDVVMLERLLPYHQHEAHGFDIPTCGICNLKVWSKKILIIHQRRVHLRERNISCPKCDMKFFDNPALTKHLVKHGAVKKHECSFCHKKFARRTTMKMHEKIHTGEKGKVCAICGEKFVQKASLNYHMGKYHPESC